MKKFSVGFLILSVLVLGVVANVYALPNANLFTTFTSNGNLYTGQYVSNEGDSLKNVDYQGFTGAAWSGYYIGTFAGNESQSVLEDIVSFYLGVPNFSAELYAKVEGGTGGSGSLHVVADTGSSGTWSLDSPYELGFYAVKAADNFALYFVDPSQESGIWSTAHLQAGGSANLPTISHFAAIAETGTSVPEPASVLLLGAGLLGLGYSVRKFKKN